MSLKQFLDGSGQIYSTDQFVSLRLIREALEKKFKLRIISESPHNAQYKIIRYVRIYGAPILFPNPTINLLINTEHNRIDYNFFWPDYYMLTFIIILGIMFARRPFILLFVLAIIFYTFLIFLDTKYVAYRVRRTLKGLGDVRE